MSGSVFGMSYGTSNRFYKKSMFAREKDDIKRKLLSYGSGMQMQFKCVAWIAKVKALKLVVARKKIIFYEIIKERVC